MTKPAFSYSATPGHPPVISCASPSELLVDSTLTRELGLYNEDDIASRSDAVLTKYAVSLSS